jgi:hypothetical protein
VKTTRVEHLELRISPQIFEKVCIGPYGILRGLGETDENLVAFKEAENFPLF